MIDNKYFYKYIAASNLATEKEIQFKVLNFEAPSYRLLVTTVFKRLKISRLKTSKINLRSYLYASSANTFKIERFLIFKEVSK